MSNKKKMGGIKKGLIVSLIGAVVLMLVLAGIPVVKAATGVTLHGEAASYAPTYIKASSDAKSVMQIKLANDTGTFTLRSVNVTFGNVTGFNATNDFAILANSVDSGVMLYYDSSGNGFGGGDDTRVGVLPTWSYGANNVSYTAHFVGLSIADIGTKYIYAVIKTNAGATNNAAFNASIMADQVSGDDGTTVYTYPSSDLFTGFTTTIDTTVPADVTGIYVNNNSVSQWTNNPSFFVNWTAVSDTPAGVAGYFYKIDSAPVSASDGLPLGGALNRTFTTADFTLPLNRSHTFYIWAKDNAENVDWQTPSTANLRYDAESPYGLTINITSYWVPNEWRWTNATAVNLTLYANDNLSGMVAGNMSFKNEEAGTWSTMESYGIFKSWALASGVDGIRTVYYRVEDKAGNVATAILDTIILDSTPPTIPSNGTVYDASKGRVGFATCNDTVTLWAVINDPTAGDGSNSGILLNATGVPYVTINVASLNSSLSWVQMVNTTGGNNFTYTMEVNWTTTDPAVGGSDGDKSLQINATDNVTNANKSKYIIVKVDKTSPLVTPNPTVYQTFTDAIGCTVNQTNATNSNWVILNATITDNGTFKYVGVNATNITGVPNNWVTLTQVGSTNYYIATVTVAGASNGTHNLLVNATDNLNQTNLTQYIVVRVDNIIPNVTNPWVNYNITAGAHPFDRIYAGNGDNVTLNITVQDNTTGSGISLVQVNVAALNTSQTWINMTFESGTYYDGYWVANVTLLGATNGTKQLLVKVWDNASNYNWTESIYVIVNNLPQVTIPTVAVDYTNYTWQNCAQNGTIINITVTVTDDDVSAVNITLNDTSTNENLTYLGAVGKDMIQVGATNTWYYKINVSATADGTYNLTINATDTAGNWNNTENVTVKVDNVKPSVSNPGVIYITDYGNNNWSANNTQVRINVTAADLGIAGIYKLWVNVSNITYPALGWVEMTNNSGNWTTVNITVNAVTGTYEIWFNATDNASNINLAVYTTVNIDNTIPTVNLSGYYNETGVWCTNNLTGAANISVKNNKLITLFVQANDTYSGILYNSSGNCWYIMVNAYPINHSLGWIELENKTGIIPGYAWYNFTNSSVTIGETIVDGNYTLQLNITDNATNRCNATTTATWPYNITVWVKGVAPTIAATTAYYPDESPTTTNASRPGNTVTINITVNDTQGCNVSWTNGVWVLVTQINSTLGWVNATYIDTGADGNIYQVNVTVGSTILSGIYNLTVYAIDTAERSSNASTSTPNYLWVNVSVDDDLPVVTNPVTIYQNGTSANSTANGGLGEWVNISVNIVDAGPAGIYNVTVYIYGVNNTLNGVTDTGEPIVNGWAKMTNNGTGNVYWANITVNKTGAGDGAHYLPVHAQDNVGHWYNATEITVLIQTMGPSVTVEVTLLVGSLGQLGPNNTAIIGNDVSVKATTSTDVVNVSVDLTAFLDAAGVSMGIKDMTYTSNGVWYYDFTIYASTSDYVNNNTVCRFNVTAYRAGYTGINYATANIDAVRPTSHINASIPQFWNATLSTTYSGCIFLNWTDSEGGQPVTFKLYYKTSTTGWSEWALLDNTAACINFTSVTDGETYYFYVKATDWAGNVETVYNLTTGDISTTVDTSLPASLSIVINNGDLFNSTGTVNITISGSDTTSGLGAISLSNDGIVWSPWYDFVSPVCTDAGNQMYSAIYGDVIVWYSAADSDLYAYNMANKTQWKIFTGTANAYKPGIYGNYIVYAATVVDYNIYAYNIATGATTAICTVTGNQLYPAIYGTIVVWQGADDNIYKYDISNPGAGITQLTTSGQASYPAIYGNYVVWQDNRNSGPTGYDIYMYNLATSTESAVCTATGAQEYPRVYASGSNYYIVWQDYRNGATTDYDIYMYKYVSGTGAEIAVCTNALAQINPMIYGDYIVWGDQRYDADYNIFMYTISTGKETQVTADTSGQDRPAVYGSYVVWADCRSGNYDIYMQQIGTSKTMSYVSWNMISGAGGNNTDGTKTVYMRIRDWANNMVVNVTDTIIYDDAAPEGLTIVINGGDNITTNRLINLTLGAYDPTSYATYDGVISDIPSTGGYLLIQFRNKTTGTWPAWPSDWLLWNGNGTYEYLLSPGDGDRAVEFRIKDRAGNIATGVTDSIMLNTGEPTTTYTMGPTGIAFSGYDADGNGWYNNATGAITVNLSATDAQNVTILWYRVTLDNGTTTGWKNSTTYTGYNWINVTYSTDANFSFTIEGIHTIEYYAINKAGTSEGMHTLYIRIDRTNSTITISPDPTTANEHWYNTAQTITLVVTDTSSEDPLNATPSGVNWTKYRVFKESVGWGYYNATDVWVTLAANTWVNYSGLSECVTLRLLEEGNYTIYVNTTDYAGNNNLTNLTTMYIRIDTTNPVPSFPNNGITSYWVPSCVVSGVYYTNSTWVVLDPEGNDPGVVAANVSGIWRFQISNDGVNWYGYNATGVWALGEYVNLTGGAVELNLLTYYWNLTDPGSLGNYNLTVYFRLYDNASNHADVNISIILDTLLPTSTITVSPGITYTDAIIMNTTDFTVTWGGSDVYNGLNGSGINQFIVQCNYSDDGGATWTGWIWNNTVGVSGTSPFSGVDGRIYYFRCNATDRLGWKGDYSTLVKVIVDITAPTSLTMAIDSDATWTNAADYTVTLTLSASDGAYGSGVYEMCFKNEGGTWSSWEAYVLTKTWTLTSGDGEKKVYFKVRDRGLLVSSEANDTIILDTVVNSPTVSSTTHTSEITWYSNNDPSVSWTQPTDLSGVIGYYYILDQSSGTIPTAATGTWTDTATASFTDKADGVWYFHIVSKDNAGNVATVATHFTVRIDTTAPTTSDNAEGLGWQNTGVTITLTGTDVGGSGVAATYYQVDSLTGTWILGTSVGILAPANHNNDGIHTIYYYSVDKAVTENSEYSNYKICYVYIDTTRPTTTATGVPTTWQTKWQNTDVVLTLSATDLTGDVSGVAATYYQIDGGAVTLYVDGITISAPSDHTNDGEHTIYFYSVDNAGNTETPVNQVIVKIDTTEPTINIGKLPTSPDGENGWYKQDVVVTITAVDALSGATGCTVEYNLDSAGWTPYTAQVAISGDGTHTIEYRATDPAGNTKTGTTVTVKIDKTAPTGLSIVINAGVAYTTSSTVDLTIFASDATSNVWKMAISNAGGGTWIDYATSFTGWELTAGDGTKYVYLTVKDNAGNEANAYASIILDTKAPVTTAVGVPTTVQDTDVVFTLSASDDLSGVSASDTYYQIGSTTGTWISGTTVTILAPSDHSNDGVHTIYFYSVDNAGKAESYKSCTVTIDTVVPDTTPPANLSIIITGTGEAVYTTSTTVTLALSAVDAVSMMISNDVYFSGATWETYNTSKTWTLSTGDGVKTVYFKCKDAATIPNVADPVSDTILLDTTPPTATIGADKTTIYTGETVQFTGSSSEPTGATYLWSFGDGVTSDVQSPSHKYTAKGTYTATLTVTDVHGLESTATSVTITVKDKPQPSGFIPGFEVLALIAAMGVAVILLRKKKL